ncbi:MAG TPA: response regulator transcription factor [Opitutaceae bacterium]|nr:response regulator transcription factor [Opitutaceae bacterium]
MSTRAVIIEDEAVFRQMLAMALGRVRGLQVAGSFGDGKAGLDFCLRTKPSLVVVDLYLPGMHGLEVIKSLRANLPATRILVLTGHPDGELPARLIAQGVHGFVDKNAPINYVLQAVESVMNGGMFFAAHVPPKTDAAAAKAANAGPKMQPDVKTGPTGTSIEAVQMLSGREIEVARLVAEGFSSKEIAVRLDLSVRTVEKHRANIMDKVGVREVASLVRWCVQSGIVRPNQQQR